MKSISNKNNKEIIYAEIHERKGLPKLTKNNIMKKPVNIPMIKPPRIKGEIIEYHPMPLLTDYHFLSVQSYL